MNVRAAVLAGLLCALMAASRLAAFSVSGTKWRTSSVTMHLQLGTTSTPLLDGFASWGASAEDALAIWNSNIGATKFTVIRDSTVSRAVRNGANNVYFSADVNGQAWGTGVLAVTLIYSSGSAQTETDVLFNNRLTWNSYRGAMRFGTGGSAIYDFHRVALHEFGHSLGLDHPDDNGQTVSALMNSHISSLDSLTSDDIAGAQSLYGPAGSAVAPPTISVQPTSRSVVVGQSTTFSVAATSTVAISYQWLKSGTAIGGATNASFSLGSVTLADAGDYAAIVSNSGGAVTSAVATLTVTSPPATPTTPTPPSTPTVVAIAPAIATAPASQTVNVGGNATFSVTANGTAPLFYQWRKDGAALSGATGTLLTLTNIQPAQAGDYSVSVSNTAGYITSAPATLTVLAPPTIATPPADQTIVAGTLLKLTVVATGTSALSYDWRKDGSSIGGATNAIYQIAEAQLTDTGVYSVVVTSSGGSVTSPGARVTVTPAKPAVNAAPVAQTVTAGDAATFTAGVTGTPPFAYQWLKDGEEIPGATSASLTISPARAADAGNYALRVSNAAGSITSTAAALTVKSSRLVNLSTRAFVPAGGTLTPGFFIRGSGSKPLLLRAVGPTLRRFGVDAALPETRLELLAQGSTTPLTTGSGYQALSDADLASSVGAFPLEPNAKDATVQTSLTPQGYTIRISAGTAAMMGVTLAEIYDADSPASLAQLVNVSTLGFVGAGENVLTAGFVVSGNAPKRLLIRAVGPGLGAFGVAGFLPDPQLALMPQGAAEPLATNDDWPDTAAMRSAFGNSGAFTLQAGSKDAALLVTLEPGAYTVIVSSVTATVTGQALVELYDLDP